jgi:hypothetical protein
LILGKLLGTDKIVDELKKLNGTSIEEIIEPKNGSFLTNYVKQITDGKEKLNQAIGKGFKSENIDDYVKALSGLNDEQKRSVIISSNLTKEQKKELLTRTQNTIAVKANTTANNENVNSDVADTASNAANTASTKADTIATNENTIAVNENTDANIANAGSDVVETATDAVETTGDVIDTVVDAGTTGTSILTVLGAKLSGVWVTIKSIGAALLGFANTHPAIAIVTGALTVLSGALGVNKILQSKNAKEIEESYQKAKEAIDETKTSLDNLKKSTDDIKDRYAELAQGVDLNTNTNLTLSTEDYNEFLGLSNQLAELFPSLTKRYDENGNAILDLAGNTDTIVGSLNELIEAQQKLASQEMSENLPGLYAGYKLNVNESKESLEKLQSQESDLEATLDLIDDIESKYGSLNELDFDSSIEVDSILREHGLTLDALNPDGLKQELKNISKKIADQQKILESETASFNSTLYTWLSGEDLYLKQSDSKFKGAIQEMLFNSDWLEQAEKENVSDDQIAQWLRDNYLSKLDDLAPEFKTKIASLFSGELTPEDTVSLAEQLQKSFDAAGIKISLGFIWDEDVDGSTADVVERFNAKNAELVEHDYSSNEGDLDSFFKQQSIDTEAEYEEWLTLASGYDTATEAMTAWTEAHKKAENELSNVEILSGVESLSDGLKQLTDIYSDVKDKGSFDYSSIFNNEDFKNTFGSYEEEYNDFIETVSNSPKDIKACQDAFNELATAYIYGKDELKNVTDETKDATVQMLKQMGVENADEVVTSALTKKKAQLAAEQEYLALTSKEVTEATWQDISLLIKEGEVAGYTAKYLAQLAWAKIDFNNINLKTNDEIEAILNIAQAAGVGESYVNALKKALINLQNQANTTTTRNNTSLSRRKDLGETALLDKPVVYEGNEVDKVVQDITDELAKIDLNDMYEPINLGESLDGSSGSDKSTSETFDHIETKLESITKKTEKLAKAFEKTFTVKGTEKKFKAYLKGIENEVDANKTAVEKYQEKLDSIGLSAEWKKKIESGKYSIEEVKGNEALKNQISEYQTWYDKKVACEEKLIELEEERAQAQATYADKIIEYHEKEIEKLEKLISKREKLIELKETFGGSASKKDYQYQIDKNTDMIDEYNKQNEDLLKKRKSVKKNSDAYKAYTDRINENKEAISELAQANAELAVEMANIPIDEYEKHLEKNEAKSDLYSAQANNTTSAADRNSYINKQINLLNKNDKKAQDTAEKTAKNIDTEIADIKSAKSSDKKGKTKAEKKEIDKLYKKIQKYTKSKKQIPASLLQKLSKKGLTNLYDQCVQYNAALVANETAQATAELSAEETQAEIRALQKEKFDNIQTEYERKQNDISNKANMLNSKMELAQAKGYLSSASWYNQLIDYEKENQASLATEKTLLENQLANIEYGTDEWWDAQDAIQAVDEAIEQSTIALQEFVNQMRQVEFDNFDYMMGQISRLTSEAEFLREMMQNKDMFNDDGSMSEYGIASLGTYAQDYEVYLKQAQYYGEEIKRIQNMLKETPNDTTLIEQMQKYEDAQRDALTATEAQKKAMVDLVKEGYQSLIDSLSDVINKYKEMINAAKNANDYQNTISEKSQEADELRKKIAAYSSMSGNEEIAAKLQQSNEDLKETEKDIQETMYDRYISDTQDALDDMLNELETFIEELDFDKIFNDAMETVNIHSESIDKTLCKIANETGIKISDAMNSIWGDGFTPQQGFKSVVDAIEKLQLDSDQQAEQAKQEVQNNVDKQAKQAEQAKQQAEQEAQKKLDEQTYKNAYEKAKKNYKDTSKLKGDDLKKAKAENKKTVEEFLKSIAKKDLKIENPSELDKKIYSITGGYIDSYAKEWVSKALGIKNEDNSMLLALKSIGFATGGIGKLVKASGEDGVAFVRNGEGFVMPENVQDIRNLMEVVPNMTKFVDTFVPNSALFTNRNIGTGDITISLGDMYFPDVTDANQFADSLADALKNNRKIQNILTTQVSSSMLNGNSLASRKY